MRNEISNRNGFLGVLGYIARVERDKEGADRKAVQEIASTILSENTKK